MARNPPAWLRRFVRQAEMGGALLWMLAHHEQIAQDVRAFGEMQTEMLRSATGQERAEHGTDKPSHEGGS